MKKRYKLSLVIIIILIILVFSVYIIAKPSKEKGYDNKIVSNIENYDYNLESRDSKLFQEHFENLKNILAAKEVDIEKYAQEISILFIVDFYSLTNKVNKYDVGGTEFIHPDYLDNFQLKAIDTLYKYLNTMVSIDKPEVKSVNIINIEETSFEITEDKKKAYEIELSWTYTKANEYDQKGKMFLIKHNEKMVIVEFRGEV